MLAGMTVRADQTPDRTFGMAVSGGFFDVIDVQPALGRGFGADEDHVTGRNPVVVLDHDLWVSRFASDPSVVGRHIGLGGADVTVIGVMPAGFTGPDQFVKPGFYLPTAMLPAVRTGGPADQLTRRDVRNFVVKGYLAPGVSLAQAAQEMALFGAGLRRDHPETNKDLDITAVTELTSRIDARPQFVVMVTMLMLLSGLVLLVACANVAGLLTSRAPARARELALRMALGAGRARLTRQMLLESLLLAAGGGVVGLGLGFAIIDVFQQISTSDRRPAEAGLRPRRAGDGGGARRRGTQRRPRRPRARVALHARRPRHDAQGRRRRRRPAPAAVGAQRARRGAGRAGARSADRLRVPLSRRSRSSGNTAPASGPITCC